MKHNDVSVLAEGFDFMPDSFQQLAADAIAQLESEILWEYNDTDLLETNMKPVNDLKARFDQLSKS